MMSLIDLNEIFIADPVSSWVRMGVILLFTFLFQKPVSKFICLKLAKFADRTTTVDDEQLFFDLTRKPIQGLLVSGLCFVAIHQLQKSLNLIIWRRTRATLHNDHILMSDVVDKIFYVLVIVFSTLLLMRIVKFITSAMVSNKSHSNHKIRAEMIPHVESAVNFSLWLIALFALLGGVFGLNVPALIASLGIGGVALALGAKETVENTISAFIILVDKPFKTGDAIQLDEVNGTVEKVGFRSTRIRTGQDTLMVVPNKNILSGNLENISERGKIRVDLKVGLKYSADSESTQLVIKNIKNLLEKNENIEEPVYVYLLSFENFALQVQITYFLKKTLTLAEVYSAKEAINLEIFKLVNQAGGFALPTQMIVSDEESASRQSNKTDNA